MITVFLWSMLRGTQALRFLVVGDAIVQRGPDGEFLKWVARTGEAQDMAVSITALREREGYAVTSRLYALTIPTREANAALVDVETKEGEQLLDQLIHNIITYGLQLQV